MAWLLGLQPFCGKGPHRRAGSLAARGQVAVNGIPNRLNY